MGTWRAASRGPTSRPGPPRRPGPRLCSHETVTRAPGARTGLLRPGAAWRRCLDTVLDHGLRLHLREQRHGRTMAYRYAAALGRRRRLTHRSADRRLCWRNMAHTHLQRENRHQPVCECVRVSGALWCASRRPCSSGAAGTARHGTHLASLAATVLRKSFSGCAPKGVTSSQSLPYWLSPRGQWAVGSLLLCARCCSAPPVRSGPRQAILYACLGVL